MSVSSLWTFPARLETEATVRLPGPHAKVKRFHLKRMESGPAFFLRQADSPGE
jgi:hypothetical protein